MLQAIKLFIFFLISLSVTAANYPLELKGKYQLESSVKKKPVEYSLQWSEKNKMIEGIYKDNQLVEEAKVRGEVTDDGRTFFVDFPFSRKGINSLVLLSPVVNSPKAGTAVNVSIITRDTIGAPLTTVKTTSQFNLRTQNLVAQKQEENCGESFGTLAGYCGIYSGILSEEMDRRNKCNLLFADAARFELRPDSTVILHLGEPNDLVQEVSHSIGRIPVNPQKDSIDILGRVCSGLVGFNSSSDTCKILHLSGRFSTVGDNRRFTGTYEITEEGKNISCRYGISMEKQVAQ